jgi:acyl dehydratase
VSGTALPTIRQTLSPARLVMYAGATWDWHALHYDAAYASAKNLERPIADGQMYGALFAAQIIRHFGPEARIERMGFRFHSMVFAGDTIEVAGDIESTEETDGMRRITATHRLMVGDRLCASGTSVTVVPA